MEKSPFRFSRLLALVFLIVLFARFYFAFRTPFFSDDPSYMALRQIEHIRQTGFPLFYDSLSYGGRTYLAMPLYNYILAAFTFFVPAAIAIKLIINIFSTSLVVAVYLIVKELAKSSRTALLLAFVSGFIPIYFSQTVNSINNYSIIIPSIFFTLYFITILEKKTEAIYYVLILLFIIFLSSPTSILLIFGLIFYTFICYLEKIRQSRGEIELIFFSIFFFLWGNFIFFKKAFETQGLHIIWQNIPQGLVDIYFTRTSIFDILNSVGVLPIIMGVVAIYLSFFRNKNQTVYLFVGPSFAVFLLYWFNLVPIILAQIFLGVNLTILAGYSLRELSIYLKKTKAARYEGRIFFLISAMLVASSVIASVYFAQKEINSSPSQDRINMFSWIRNNTEENSTVLIPYTEGNMLTYFAGRKNVMDSDFLLIGDAETRLNNTLFIYTTNSEIEALRLIDWYGINYIVIDREAEDLYNITKLRYQDNNCFTKVYNKRADIYSVRCTLEK